MFSFLILIIIKLSFSSRCVEGENFCLKCDNQNDICIQCKNEILVPNEQGECIGIKKCSEGKNFCFNCDIEGDLCQYCETGFFPDNNGGCSYIDNCEISYNGLCLKCKENFILIGPDEDFKLCKSIYSSDLKNCKIINEKKGTCDLCEESYFLGKGDLKCTNVENCYESTYGKCDKCIDNFYLERKKDVCLLKENQFKNCKESINGITCEICDNNYFLSEDLFCIKSNFCSETKDFNCLKCNNNYYLAKNGNCSTSENCKNSEGNTGLCKECLDEYYLDLKDEKCKSNKFDEDHKFCSKFNEICISCINNYFLGEDNRCSSTRNCSESENGICLYCSNDYVLGKDNKCTKIDHCIYSNINYECIECEENYILSNKTCKLLKDDDDIFKNCKIADDAGKICTLCKNDFYLNKTNNLCYSNKEYGKFYKCKISSSNANICEECISGYYLGYKDKKCTHTAACISSNENNECNRCDVDYFCLNLFNHTCENNEYISNENKMIFYKCNITNESGTKCELCKDNFILGENGYCVNIEECDIKENDICLKCREKNVYNYELCLNKYFGCVETSVVNCLRCDDPLDTETCTECYEGYRLTEDNHCKIIDN